MALAGTRSPLRKYSLVVVSGGMKLMYCSPATERFWIVMTLPRGIL